jgi:oleate hydratase
MNLFMPVFKSEKCLARSRICDYFHESFFQTIFWLLLATISILRTEECFICDYTYGDSFDDSFGFQSWHSLVEFRRYVHRFMYNIHELDHPQQLYRPL